MNLAQLHSLNRGIIYTILALVPVVFWRSVTDSFDLTKGTVLNVFGAFLLGGVVLVLGLGGWRQVARPVWAVVGALACALIIATATSLDPVVSVVGQAQRYTGLATLMTGLLVVIAMVSTFQVRHLITATWVLVATAVVVNLYTLIQESGNDPFDWFSESFGKFVFSTLGNPNTGAAYTAVTLPLLAWAMLRREHHVGVRVGAGAVFGAALGSLAVLGSFQGPVAAVVTVAYLAAWAWLEGRATGNWIVAGIMTLGILLIPARTGSTTEILLSALAFAALAGALPWLRSLTLPKSWYEKRKAIGGVAIGIVVVLGVVAGPQVIDRVQQQVDDGMYERSSFYRAAVEVFKDEPIFGSGLETFGFVYGQYRPEEHATQLEGSRTSSVHSVPLGMFANGGIILGVAYLAFVGFVGRALVLALRRDLRAGSGTLLAAGAAWTAYQVQSLVSVEHVALFTLHFGLAGIVLAYAYPNQAAVESTAVKQGSVQRQRRRQIRTRQVPALAVGGVGLVSLLLVVFVITRPMQAARASYVGLSAIYSTGDAGTALRELDSATDAAPWEAIYWVQLTEVYQSVGATESAAAAAREAAERSHFNPGLTPSLATVIANSGDLATALEFVERAIANDPLAPGVSKSGADLYAQAGVQSVALGDVDTARSRFERALEIDPDNVVAREQLANLGG